MSTPVNSKSETKVWIRVKLKDSGLPGKLMAVSMASIVRQHESHPIKKRG